MHLSHLRSHTHIQWKMVSQFSYALWAQSYGNGHKMADIWNPRQELCGLFYPILTQIFLIFSIEINSLDKWTWNQHLFKCKEQIFLADKTWFDRLGTKLIHVYNMALDRLKKVIKLRILFLFLRRNV